MTLVNYAYHTNVTDSKDWLAKLRTFAIAQGWDGNDYRTNVEWDVAYPYTGWLAGDGDFLQLTSTCYGSCDKAVYRFYAENQDASEDLLHHCAHTTNVYDAAVSTWPVRAWYGGQNCWAADDDYWGTSMPSSDHGIDKMWLFGNQYYIYVVCQFDDYLMPTWHFGSIDLYPEHQSRTDCAFYGSSNWQFDIDSDSQTGDWSWALRARYRWGPGLLFGFPYILYGTDRPNDVVYFSGQGQNWDDEGASYSYWPEFAGSSFTSRKENGAYNFCKNVLEVTGYSAKRLGFRVDFFAKDTDAGDIVPLGKTPFYVIPFNGMSPGESVTYDGKTYLCFPFIFTWWNRGYAFRIA